MTRRSGQAAVEFTVAIVCVLLLVAALLQLVIFADADTGPLAEATARASEAATGGGFPDSFAPVRDWDAGPDGLFFTRDDAARPGSLARLRSDIAARTAPGGDWSAFDGARSTALRSLAQRGDPALFNVYAVFFWIKKL